MCDLLKDYKLNEVGTEKPLKNLELSGAEIRYILQRFREHALYGVELKSKSQSCP